MRHGKSELTQTIRSVVEPMGYELVGVEYFQRGSAGALLRVYIDHPPSDRGGEARVAARDAVGESAERTARSDVAQACGPSAIAGGVGGASARGIAPKGITLDDCSAVSRQLSGVLDVEDPIAGQYVLEVSSPGLDRPLFTLDHYRRFRGQRVRLRLAAKLEGRRKLEGRILDVEQEAVLLGVDGETFSIPLDVVESARLVPQLRFGNRQ